MDGQENKTTDDQKINPKFSLETQMDRLKLAYFRHIVQRPRFLEKVRILGKKGSKGGKKEKKIISSMVDDGLNCSGNKCLKVLLGSILKITISRESK